MIIVRDGGVLFGSEISVDESKKADKDIVVPVFHYARDVYRPHGIPFKFLIKGVSKYEICDVYVDVEICGC